MEDMGLNTSFWQNRRVLVTGHTGFKGSWLSLWLHRLGAEVTGLALDPPSRPALHDLLGLHTLINDVRADIRNSEDVSEIFYRYRPETVFHLAAQSLVRPSYDNPIDTLSVNIMGSANILEASRHTDSIESVVIVTSDKCYENNEWHWPYRETDKLGGHDPYSGSKSCTEIITQTYRRSFFNDNSRDRCQIATARAGNVIGGGDWAKDRIVPDIIRALSSGRAPVIRNPGATRPWQHVLDPLHGYLMLAEKLTMSQGYDQAWNFGPDASCSITVSELCNKFMAFWPDMERPDHSTTSGPHEANHLMLDASMARQRLGWRPVLHLDETIEWTAEWYQAWHKGYDIQNLTYKQIDTFMDLSGGCQ